MHCETALASHVALFADSVPPLSSCVQVIDTYRRLRAERLGSVLLTKAQEVRLSIFSKRWSRSHDPSLPAVCQMWVENMRLVISLKTPILLHPPPNAPLPVLTTLRHACFRIATWKYFDQVVGYAILFNILAMCVKHANQGPAFERFEFVANAVFTTLFSLEATVLIVGLGPSQYFQRGWNCFDFILALGCIVTTIAEWR